VRANGWALGALAVLTAASVWWSFAWDWTSYQQHRPSQAVDVPPGGQARLGPADFALKRLVVLEGDSAQGRAFGVQPGTDVVVADLVVTPAMRRGVDDTRLCELRLLAPSPDGEREWWPATSNPTTFPEGDPGVYGCDIAGGSSYLLREFFVVPADGADGDAVLLVTVREELPRALRLHR
jgi:hypothetical protein